MSTEEYPRLSDEQAIARDAEKIFEGLLSSRLWNDTKIPQERDFGLDYRIEAVSDGQLKGCEFLVQLKGTTRVPPGTSSVPLSVSTRTLWYWKRKILPILIVLVDCSTRKGYFLWFDKSLDFKTHQATQTVPIPIDRGDGNVLDDSKLLFSLQPLYASFVQEATQESKRHFYRHLFSQVNSLTSVFLLTCMSQLFAPAGLTDSDDARARLVQYRQERIDLFLMLFIKFIQELRLYTAAIRSLASNPIDQGLAAAIARLFALHDTFAFQAAEISGFGVMMTNPERALMSLPEIASLFHNIQESLKSVVLRP